jgi:hypothetical protein
MIRTTKKRLKRKRTNVSHPVQGTFFRRLPPLRIFAAPPAADQAAAILIPSLSRRPHSPKRGRVNSRRHLELIKRRCALGYAKTSTEGVPDAAFRDGTPARREGDPRKQPADIPKMRRQETRGAGPRGRQPSQNLETMGNPRHRPHDASTHPETRLRVTTPAAAATNSTSSGRGLLRPGTRGGQIISSATI